MEDPKLVSDLARLKAVSQDFKEYEDLNQKLSRLEAVEKSLADNEKLIKDGSELATLAQEELPSLRAEFIEIEKALNETLRPQDPMDKKNVIVEIRAGTGGDEAAIFAADLSRMYMRFAEKKGWKVSLMSTNRIGIG